jgi:two-component system sensor histidine kinase BaeS
MAEALEASEQRRRQLLADLAHELRTPLATIDGYLEGAADKVMAADAQTLQVLQGETARLRRLVDDLDAVSGAEERQLDLHLAPCHPDKLVTAAAQAAQAAYTTKGVALATRVDPHLPRVAAEPTASARCSPTCSATPCATPTRRPRRSHRHHNDRRPGAGFGDRHQ